MPVSKQVFGLTLRCCGALSAGLSIVAVITLGLLFISADADDTPAARMAAYTLKFPEDEQMLKDLSAEILKDTDIAHADRLEDIQPAAGAPK